MLALRRASRASRAPRAAWRRALAATPPPGDDDAHQSLGINTRPGGLPELVESWGRGPFRTVGYGLGAATVAAVPLAFFDTGVSSLVPTVLGSITGAYW
jgi:hypothetical protein